MAWARTLFWLCGDLTCATVVSRTFSLSHPRSVPIIPWSLAWARAAAAGVGGHHAGAASSGQDRQAEQNGWSYPPGHDSLAVWNPICAGCTAWSRGVKCPKTSLGDFTLSSLHERFGVRLGSENSTASRVWTPSACLGTYGCEPAIKVDRAWQSGDVQLVAGL